MDTYFIKIALHGVTPMIWCKSAISILRTLAGQTSDNNDIESISSHLLLAESTELLHEISKPFRAAWSGLIDNIAKHENLVLRQNSLEQLFAAYKQVAGFVEKQITNQSERVQNMDFDIIEKIGPIFKKSKSSTWRAPKCLGHY